MPAEKRNERQSKVPELGKRRNRTEIQLNRHTVPMPQPTYSPAPLAPIRNSNGHLNAGLDAELFECIYPVNSVLCYSSNDYILSFLLNKITISIYVLICSYGMVQG